MLYQRVIQVAEKLAGSRATLASAVGKEPRTFQGYLTQKREDNLWPLLPKMLEVYPRLSRQWLYFGEGPMVLGRGIPLDKPIPVRALAGIVEEIAKETGGDYRDLLEYMLGLPQDTKETNASAITEEQLRTLERKLMALHEELAAASKKIINLQDELLDLHRRQSEPPTFPSGASSTTAPGTDSVVPLYRQKTE